MLGSETGRFCYRRQGSLSVPHVVWPVSCAARANPDGCVFLPLLVRPIKRATTNQSRNCYTKPATPSPPHQQLVVRGVYAAQEVEAGVALVHELDVLPVHKVAQLERPGEHEGRCFFDDTRALLLAVGGVPLCEPHLALPAHQDEKVYLCVLLFLLGVYHGRRRRSRRVADMNRLRRVVWQMIGLCCGAILPCS